MKITKIEVQKHNKKRYSIFIDEEYSFGITERGLIKLSLYKGKEIDINSLNIIKNQVVLEDAKEVGLNYLSYMPRSKKQVREKLENTPYENNIIESVLEYLTDLKFINDYKYALMYINDKMKFKPSSKREIYYKLKNLGIDREYIDQAIEELEFNEQDSIEKIMEKKIRKGSIDKKKIYKYLFNRGFFYNNINKILTKY